MVVSLGTVLAQVSHPHLEGTILPRGLFLGLGLIYLLVLGLDRLCERLALLDGRVIQGSRSRPR